MHLPLVGPIIVFLWSRATIAPQTEIFGLERNFPTLAVVEGGISPPEPAKGGGNSGRRDVTLACATAMHPRRFSAIALVVPAP
jgi:hypothetical protein